MRQHRQVPQCPDRRAAEQGRELVTPRRAGEAIAGKLGKRKQGDGAAAADQSALQAQQQEMPLEVTGDEAVGSR